MSLLLKTDVTSVKIHGNYILAGIGSSSNIFEKSSGVLVQRLMCLNGQKIYAFVVSSCGQNILVFGGKQFTVLSVNGKQTEYSMYGRNFEPITCDDWLHSAVWVNEDKIAVLTAHNVVQIWSTSTLCLISQHSSKDNSILYSGSLMNLGKNILVLAGTVFSEVIIHVCGEEQALQRLKGHKGVIFSISCDLNKGLIVTTSDDRSVRIWKPDNMIEYPCNTIQYWKKANFVCYNELYGHTARVMRSCISVDKIISVGEDSAICFWNIDGSLARKILSHQNSPIWAVDNDDSILVTGGGDGAVITHPFTVATDYCTSDLVDIENSKAKKLIFSARRNLVILTEDDELIYYNAEEKTKAVHKLNHESTYKLMSLSSCKQMIAVGDMNGKLDVFAENCKDTPFLVNVIDTKLPVGKILSMQWAGNRFLVICLEKGVIKVLASKEANTESYAEFLLPNCKERWLTAATVVNSKDKFVLGDRCGNIHVFVKGQINPLKTFSKVHGRYGPTSITVKNTDVITTGRDGTVKYFSLDNNETKLLCSKDMEFKWIEKFLDKDENIVCGFQERVFVVYNLKTNSKILEVACGGGHRSWDAVRYFEKFNEEYEEFIKLVYLKNSDINVVTFQLSKIVSKIIVSGTHSKEVNCLKTCSTEKLHLIVISGGEDTTLRISSIDSDSTYEDLAIFKQLSSVRTLKIHCLENNKYLVMSAGGRAQFCVKIVTVSAINDEVKVKTEELIDYMIKGTDKERKGNQNWRNCAVDFDPETRIMDIDYSKVGDNNFLVFAGCSDAVLRVYSLSLENQSFDSVTELKYHKTCILKTTCINFANTNILVTCSTRGEVVFWDVPNINGSSKPFFVTKTNKSGINSFAFKKISEGKLLISTGGDDNAIHLLLLKLRNQSNEIFSVVLDSKVFDRSHSSEITGLVFIDDMLISASIDQRVSVFKWTVSHDAVECTFVSQLFSNVADIQGIDVISTGPVRVCVFGKGLEVVEIPMLSGASKQ